MTSSPKGPKQALYAEFATIAQALAHAHRLELLEHTAQGERRVDELAALAGLSVANASQHLKQLRQAGLVQARRSGRFVRYRVANEAVLTLLAALEEAGQQQRAEVGRIIEDYYRRRDSMEPVTREELQARMDQGLVTVLDVRPAAEFALGHLPGAINLPLAELDSRLKELDPQQEIVAYCRGPWCVFAYEVVSRLRDQGYQARRLEDGLPQWRAAGLPVQS